MNNRLTVAERDNMSDAALRSLGDQVTLLKAQNADLLAALRVVDNCLPDEEGGVTLGSYEQGVVRDAIARVQS